MRLASISDVERVIPPIMRGFPRRWCVAAGWAIDLFLGRMTREHADVELAVFREDQGLLQRHFPDWTFQKVVGGCLTPWLPGEELSPPVHEIHGRCAGDSCLSAEFLLNERADNDWVFRRNPEVRLVLDQAILRGDTSLPILSPAVVLLFKAKNAGRKDEMDFQSVRDELGTESRQWLHAALRACHPQHPWLSAIL